MPDAANALQPLHERVYDDVAQRLSTDWRPGSRLPSERALADELGVSRLTVRKALAALGRDGLIERGEGRGWFVASADAVSEPPNQLLGFSALARQRGLVPSARVLERRVRDATIGEAERLRIAPGAPLFELERLRLLDDVAIAVHIVRIPVARAPFLLDIDFSSASIHAALEEHDIVPSLAEYVVEVFEADRRLAMLLGVREGQGLLLSSGETRDQHGVPIELGWIAYRPDRYRLRTTLRRPGWRGPR
ncbi:MAG: GntR family transcriptional regulator [Thermoleophilia bacterium]|nr:GntR family transcriptional regulator [Thermoleophilia bacterium]